MVKKVVNKAEVKFTKTYHKSITQLIRSIHHTWSHTLTVYWRKLGVPLLWWRIDHLWQPCTCRWVWCLWETSTWRGVCWSGMGVPGRCWWRLGERSCNNYFRIRAWLYMKLWNCTNILSSLSRKNNVLQQMDNSVTSVTDVLFTTSIV